jgi:hypothetical protein
MRSVEVSIQQLITSGFDPNLAQDPYRCFVYTSFQERATKISHRRTAQLANERGATTLRDACNTISVRVLEAAAGGPRPMRHMCVGRTVWTHCLARKYSWTCRPCSPESAMAPSCLSATKRRMTHPTHASPHTCSNRLTADVASMLAAAHRRGAHPPRPRVHSAAVHPVVGGRSAIFLYVGCHIRKAGPTSDG